VKVAKQAVAALRGEKCRHKSEHRICKGGEVNELDGRT
jgi:hypothetical protein